MSIWFWVMAVPLALAAAAFVLLPLRLAMRREVSSRQRINVELYEDRLAELEAERADGTLGQDEFDALKAELSRNLLTETEDSGEREEVGVRHGRAPIIAAALVPLAAVVFYADFGLSWGALDDLELAAQLRNLDPSDPAGIESAIGELARVMERQPDNDQGWFLLANSRINLGDYDGAAAAFDHLRQRYPDDANLAANYAEALFMAEEQQLTEPVRAAVDRAMKLDPDNLSMLEILGMTAYRIGDLGLAREYFQRALAAGAQGERARMLEGAIASVESTLRERGELPPAAAGATGGASEDVGTGRSLAVRVDVADGVDVPLDAVVFVFARAAEGPPMPLAVQRLNRGSLPTTVRLDESMAMMEGMGLGNFDRVRVVARISMSGNAAEADFEAMSDVVDLTGDVAPLDLLIGG